jgi:hypothetical protein
MSKNLKILNVLRQLHHTQRTGDVAVDGLVEPSVEINAGRAVHDHVATLYD